MHSYANLEVDILFYFGFHFVSQYGKKCHDLNNNPIVFKQTNFSSVVYSKEQLKLVNLNFVL